MQSISPAALFGDPAKLSLWRDCTKLWRSLPCLATRYSSAITSSSLTKTGPLCLWLSERHPRAGHHIKYLYTSSSIRVSKKMPTKKWAIRKAASPFRFYQAQVSSGICFGIMTPSSVVSSTLDDSKRVLLEENRIPCVTQKEGNMQNTHRKGSPTYIVTGMYWSTKTITTSKPPVMKCKKRVEICALMSDLNRKDVT